MIGQTVIFECDVKQKGIIIGTDVDPMGRLCVTIENKSGFSGAYLEGATQTNQLFSECILPDVIDPLLPLAIWADELNHCQRQAI